VPQDLGIISPEALRNCVKQAKTDRALATGQTTKEIADFRYRSWRP
jgi:hypothetical protein